WQVRGTVHPRWQYEVAGNVRWQYEVAAAGQSEHAMCPKRVIRGCQACVSPRCQVAGTRYCSSEVAVRGGRECQVTRWRRMANQSMTHVILRVSVRGRRVSVQEHQSDTYVITMKMEILPVSTSNSTANDSILQAGNPVKEIFLKLNLPDHKSILTDLKEYLKMDVEVPGSSRLTDS
ncbi:hypothetical protein Tco_1354723, partial [Tanacetum coccineum]